ncbi:MULTISPECIES: hypothetical protein [unclassified Streptomyces]|uniref:hypothetical protein n=1 Tax=unclassified Streptomyces TaxID=2593676 RepID=UPI0038304A60
MSFPTRVFLAFFREAGKLAAFRFGLHAPITSANLSTNAESFEIFKCRCGAVKALLAPDSRDVVPGNRDVLAPLQVIGQGPRRPVPANPHKPSVRSDERPMPEQRTYRHQVTQTKSQDTTELDWVMSGRSPDIG